MKKILFIVSLLFITTATFGQAGQATRTAKSDPTGLACTANSPVLEYQGGRYTCESSVYALTSVKRAAYAIASLPTCNASRVNATVNVTDGNRGQRTCRETSAGVYEWVDDNGGVYLLSRFGSLAAAVAAAGTSSEIVADVSHTLTASVTILSGQTLRFSNDAVITLGAFDLTIAGSLAAEKKQIFSQNSTGQVFFEQDSTTPSRTLLVYPEWWGAVGDDSTDDTAALQAAADSLSYRGYGEIRLSRMYRISQPWDFASDSGSYRTRKAGTVVRGIYRKTALSSIPVGLRWTGAGTDVVIKAHARDLLFEAFTIITTSTSKSLAGIDIDHSATDALAQTGVQVVGVSVTTDNQSRRIKGTFNITGGDRTLTIPTISGTWTASGSVLNGTSGAALSEIMSGSSIVVSGSTYRVKFVENDNKIHVEGSPSGTGVTITHAATFAASNVGDWIVLSDGGNAAYEYPLVAQIASRNSATSVELDRDALRTVTGGRFFSSPIASAIRIGATAPYNADFQKVIDSYFMDTAIGIWIPSTTGQCKQLQFKNTNLGVNGYGILQVTGSFHADTMNLGTSHLANLGLFAPTDIIKLDGVDSEESSRLLITFTGSTAGWPIQISNVRWNATYADSDGYVVRYGHGGPLTLQNFQLEPVGGGEDISRCKIYNFGGPSALISGQWPSLSPFAAASNSNQTIINTIGWNGASYTPINLTSRDMVSRSNSANALAVGANGATNPVVKVNAATASVATGIEITGAAAGNGATVAAISSGSNENLILTGKGTGGVAVGTSGAAITSILSGTASLDFAQALANTCEELNITVTGAADGNPVQIGVPNALANHNTTATFTAWISAADTVKVRRCVISADGSDPAAATVRATVTKH